MGFTVRSYHYVSELAGLLDGIKKDFSNVAPEKFKFIVPSGNDKTWWPGQVQNRERDLWTWDEIYKNVCDHGKSKRKGLLSPPDHLLILNLVLKNFLTAHSEKVSALPGLARPGFLTVISRDIRELMNEGVKPEQLIFNPESGNASEFLLPEVYLNYIKYLETYELLDSAQVYTAAHEEIIKNQEWGRGFIMIFVGFLSFTHAQLELLKALRDRCGEVIILKPETNLEKFHDADIQLRGINSAIGKSEGNIIKIPVAEPGLEPEVIARGLALMRPESFDDVGIMITAGREESFAEAFSRYGVPYDFVSGIRINLTLPGKILTSIRHLNSRNFPAYETAMLLTQPCFAGSKFPFMKVYRNGPSGLDYWEEYLSKHLEESESFQVALLSVQAIKKFRNVMNRQNRPARIMEAFYDFLTTENLWLDRFNTLETANIPELDEVLRSTASAIETIGGKVLALNELLPDLGEVQTYKIKTDEAYDFLERWCANTDTRPPLQISNAVRIFTKTPPVLSYFPVWIMTGISQNTWSANIFSSPLLGVDEREKLAENRAFLPTNSDKADQHEALFRRLIQVGEKVTVISTPKLDEEGRPLSESPFLEKFFEDMPGWKVQNGDDVKNNFKGIKILLGSDGFIFPEVDPCGKISREIPLINKKFNAVGASDIHRLLSCPFLWWQGGGANLYPNDTEIYSQIEWGNMLHKFWERVWRFYRLDTAQKFSDIADAEWNFLIDFEKWPADFEDYKKYSRLVQDLRLRRKLSGHEFRVKRLAKIQSEILEKLYDSGYEHEKILLEDEAHLRAEIDGIIFLGQCDRIEIFKTPSGEKTALIADYKEGRSEIYEKGLSNIKNYSWNVDGREKFSHGLQLSVYAALFERNFNKDIKLNGVYILGHEDGKISGSISTSNDAEIFDILKNYRSEKKFKSAVLERIDEGEYAMACAAKVLQDGKFAPEYDSDSCRLCAIKSLCRRGEFSKNEEPETDEE